jgi:nucleoside-diphosphate-sugar epimerase
MNAGGPSLYTNSMTSESGANNPQDCILITGSSGRIGKAFINRFHDRFTEFAFDREGPPHPPHTAEHIIPCDISSDESVKAALAETRRLGGGRIASVLHLAAFYDFSGKPSPLYREITVKGTERLLRGLRDFEVEQFVFTSTMLVHAPVVPGEVITESSLLAPAWAYPKSKVETEEVLHRERGVIPTVSLRVAGVYDDGVHSIPLAQHMQRIHERRFLSHFFPGEFEHGQSFLHMDDLVDALYLTIVRRHLLPPETVLLLGESDVMSFAELQHDFARLIHGQKYWVTLPVPKLLAKIGAWVQEKMPGSDPFIRPWMIDRADDHYALDTSLARTLLHWEPQHSLRKSLPAMVASLKADPKAWYKENGLEPRA